MKVKAPIPDAVFIEQQRRYLLKLRAVLTAAARNEEDEEADIKRESADRPREYEDDAQKLANLELAGNLVVRDIGRLDRVDRALRKLEEGTYGLSDLSGKAIARERLEAVPEAICTLDEEDELERGSSVRRGSVR
jgi:RNA polymerase-binding transcription factor